LKSSSTTIDGGKELWALKGVWWAINEELHGVCLEASDPKILKGEDEPSKVTEISRDHYVIRNWRGDLKKYERFK
jgi:hypothetical protein